MAVNARVYAVKVKCLNDAQPGLLTKYNAGELQPSP
jgi:hypothetical protein